MCSWFKPVPSRLSFPGTVTPSSSVAKNQRHLGERLGAKVRIVKWVKTWHERWVIKSLTRLQKAFKNIWTDDRGLGGHLSNYTSGWFELHRLLRHNKNGASEPPTTKTGSRSRICPGQVHFFWHVPLMFMGRYVAPFFVVDSWWN